MAGSAKKGLQMATVAISGLPAASAAAASDIIPIVQGGITKKLTNTLLFTSPTIVTPTITNPAVSTGTFTSPTINTGTLTNPTVSTGTFTSPTMITPVLGAATATSLAVSGLATVGTTFGVTGATTLASTLAVTGVSTLTGGAVVQGMTVGKGLAAVATNTAVGFEVLKANTIGDHNVGVGYSCLQANLIGVDNTAIGYQALFTNNGTKNTATGYQALRTNGTGNSNTAYGNLALYGNSTGDKNTACGGGALESNVGGSYNVGIGQAALFNNGSGSGNTGVNPFNSAGTYAPVFDPVAQNDRFCMGSTGVTNAYIQVAWTVVSDARDKTDFAPVPHGLDFVSNLKPIAYRYKINRESIESHGPVRYGFKAQEVLALEGDTPVVVDAEDSEKLKFNDQSLIAVLVNAIQELNLKFETYKLTHP